MQPHSPSPSACLQLLELFAARRVELTIEQYDEYFDKITDILEKANNESFRLHGDKTEGV